jgi:hypothetical protein
MNSESLHISLSKDIGKVAVLVAELGQKLDSFEKYQHDKNHEIVNEIQKRDKRWLEHNKSIEILCSDVATMKEQLSDNAKVLGNFRALKQRGIGIIIALLVVFGSAGATLKHLLTAVK